MCARPQGVTGQQQGFSQGGDGNTGALHLGGVQRGGTGVPAGGVSGAGCGHNNGGVVPCPQCHGTGGLEQRVEQGLGLGGSRQQGGQGQGVNQGQSVNQQGGFSQFGGSPQLCLARISLLHITSVSLVHRTSMAQVDWIPQHSRSTYIMTIPFLFCCRHLLGHD